MLAILIRTCIIFGSLTLVLRLMGKRQVGELEVSDLVPTLLLSEVAVLPIDNIDIPLAHALVPMVLLFSLEVIITFAKTKWNPLKKIFESKPVFLIQRGKLNQRALADNRITLDELLGECRAQGIGDITQLYYAILEQDGKLSLLERTKNGKETGIAHPLIIDGALQEDSIREANMTEQEVLGLAYQSGHKPKNIFLLQCDDAGNTYCIPREKHP